MEWISNDIEGKHTCQVGTPADADWCHAEVQVRAVLGTAKQWFAAIYVDYDTRMETRHRLATAEEGKVWVEKWLKRLGLLE